MFSGGAIGQVVAILTAPIITRLFTPEDFGIFALFFSIASLIGGNSQFAYHQALIIPEKEDVAHDLFVLSVVLTLIVSLLSLLILWVLPHSGLRVEWVHKLGIWTYWLPLAIFLIGINIILSCYSNRYKQYVTIAASTVTGNTIAPCSRIFLGILCGSSVWILVFTQLLALVAQVAVMLRKIADQVKDACKKATSFGWIQTSTSFRDFPFYSLPSNLLASIGVQMPTVIIAAMTSPAIVGFYAVANRLVSRPLLPIQEAVRQVYQRRVTEKLNAGENIQKEFVQITLVLFIIGLIPFGVIALWGTELFSLVLGNRWAETGRIAAMLIPWLYTSFILPPANAVLVVGRLNRFRLNYLAASTIIRIAALYFGMAGFGDPMHGLLLFSAISAVANLVLILFTYTRASRLNYGEPCDA